MVNHINIITILFICYAKCEYLDLREGKKCVWKGANGTCVNIFKCGKAKYDIENNKEYPPICAYDEKVPVICCIDCSADPNSKYDYRNDVFNPHVGMLHKTGSVAGDSTVGFNSYHGCMKCTVIGEYDRREFVDYLDKLEYPCKLYMKATQGYIWSDYQNCYFRSSSSSGFSDAGITYQRKPNFLHTVLLGYGSNVASAQWLCGGSVISENYILTSANCTSSPDHGPVRYIVMGILNDTSLPDPWQSYAVKRIIPHPEYRPSSKYHDIALLETEIPIVFSVQVLPISLVTSDDYKPKAVAWSELRHGKGLAETLESVSETLLKGYGDVECSLFYQPQPTMVDGYNDTIQICYGSKGQKIDVCEGDNGASIFTKDSTTCTVALLGVTSLGRTCGPGGAGSALYTRVSFYLPWIESVVWPSKSDNKAST